MALIDKKKKSLQADKKPTPQKPHSILEENKGLGASKEKLRSEFRKMTDKTTSYGSHTTSLLEKLRLPEELFPSSKYGAYIDRHEVDSKIAKLKQHESLSKRLGDTYEASRYKDRIDFLKKLKEK